MAGRRHALIAAAVLLLIGAGVAGAAPRPLTRANAAAAAAAVNLRHSDVPSLRQLPALSAAQIAQGHRDNAKLASCYNGVPYAKVLADVESPGFQSPGTAYGELVSSDTEIFPTAALAAADLAAAAGSRGRACVLAAYRSQIAGTLPASVVLNGSIAPLPVTLAGTHAVGVRMTFSVRSRPAPAGAAVVLTVDALGFSYGQAEVGVVVTSNPGAPSHAQEHALAATLLARAHTALG